MLLIINLICGRERKKKVSPVVRLLLFFWCAAWKYEIFVSPPTPSIVQFSCAIRLGSCVLDHRHTARVTELAGEKERKTARTEYECKECTGKKCANTKLYVNTK